MVLLVPMDLTMLLVLMVLLVPMDLTMLLVLMVLLVPMDPTEFLLPMVLLDPIVFLTLFVVLALSGRMPVVLKLDSILTLPTNVAMSDLPTFRVVRSF